MLVKVLLASDSGNKKLQESVGVDVDTNFRIRRDLIHTLNNVMIAVQDVAFNRAMAIRNAFAARELAPLSTSLSISGDFTKVSSIATPTDSGSYNRVSRP